MGTAGPMNAAVTIPPRPKPGRKPATDDPPSKRKAQNREAQRAFRERRAKRVEDMEKEIRDLKEAHKLELEAAEARYQALSREFNLQRRESVLQTQSLSFENQDLRNEVAALQHRKKLSLGEPPLKKRQLYVETEGHGFNSLPTAANPGRLPPLLMRHQSGPLTPPMLQPMSEGNGHASPYTNLSPSRRLPTPKPSSRSSQSSELLSSTSALDNDVPMADVYPDLGRCYEAQETDFTNFGKGPSRPDVPVPSTEAVPSPAVTDHEKCGFCTDESNCVCIPLNQEHQGRDQDKDATGDDDAIGEPDTSEESVSPSHPEPSTSTSDPTLPLTEPTSNKSASTAATPTDTCTTATAVLPGTCDACLRDPTLKRACETLASRQPPLNMAPPPTLAPMPSFTAPSYDSLVNLERIFSVSEASSSGGTATTSSDQAMPIHNGSVGCADAFIWLVNAQVDINEDWVQSMLAVAPQGGSRRGTAAGEGVGIGRRMTAFDIEGASILATLNVARRHGSSQMSPTNGGE
ncbi:hypothetical protein H2201_007285 [Coniosporium apollinis]|uniref:BZIP domain-containing protein n=1 Tax=Coniosporium apollinis TaxID=61459 RepID=A0ABQ9NJ93_9PEZI|nr:hypothetical protein H2201_007285 [Coniosporium apollinis]